jgi:two-component system, sensor histidine kinase and response regulator
MPDSLPSNAGLPPGGPAAGARPRGTLLIVDDEEGPRQSLRAMFKDDYEVLLAADGPAAIALARDNKIDVAVLDIRLGDMSGIEVLERLKYVDPSIDAVMLTAYETAETLHQALRLRACEYFAKPFDVPTMRAAVANAMLRRTIESDLHTNEEKMQQLAGELLNQKIEEETSATRGEIYASIIHDINGPLTAIAGYGQLMSLRVGDSTRLKAGDLEFLKRGLQIINREVTNCIEISRRYLSFLRCQPGEPPRVAANQLLTDLAHLVRTHPSLHDNQFTIRSLPEDLAVRANGTDVIQILLNLTVNAFQCSSQPHCVEMRASAVAQPLDLLQFKDGPQERMLNVEHFENAAPLLAIAIRDNGPGIPPELLPRIFQPYFTTKPEGLGTGLGLGIVQRLIKHSKGALHVRTRLGAGTTFTVYLPAAPLGPASPAQPG